MNTFIVYYHPEPQSFNGTLLRDYHDRLLRINQEEPIVVGPY